ncbi:MAG: phosphoribosylglycinamide formyltransferase [Firmicutes bacterium]|nr:phosphoribosylglycinamide formyltransferase [Bacillota bacterium]MTI70123.1 phosphoribosylglycinamide formyltransferase [Bacillota bacterium]
MSSVKIGVLISGGGTNLQSLIDSINDGNINGEIVLVISDNKKAYGLKRAEKNGIDNMYINRLEYDSSDDYNEVIIEKMKEKKVELVVLAGYLKILNEKFVKKYQNKIINIHPSLIPSFCGKGYYGTKVHKACLDYGVKVTGATAHFVDKGTDTGPIILQRVVNIDNEDTVKSLKEKVLKVEHKILPEAVRLYCEGKIELKKQNNRFVTKIRRG